MRRLLLLLAMVAAADRLAAQPSDVLTDVRALYESAAYEEALTRVANVDAAAVTPALEEYRAFCLIALGRLDQASSAIQRAVEADPDFVPSAADASPRVRTLFEETRRRLLPAIIKRLYGTAKVSFSASDFAAANAGFTRVVTLADAIGGEAAPELADLRLVAKEFVDLSAQRMAAKAPAAAAPAANAGPGTAAAQPPARPPAAPAAPQLDTRPAVPINQVLPVWKRREGSSGTPRTDLTGEVLIAIDETGSVISARTTKFSDPTYDFQVVEAARSWRYTPAMRNGKPLPSERTITYVLKVPRL